jgi:hypothetical protein
MTPAQYRDALTRLGLTQAAAAQLLSIDDRTSRRWAQHGTHGPSEILLRLLLTGRIRPADIHHARRYRPSRLEG